MYCIAIVYATILYHTAEDPLGGLKLTAQDFYYVTKEICAVAAEVCQSRVVAVLEGGYDLTATSDSAIHHVMALTEAAHQTIISTTDAVQQQPDVIVGTTTTTTTADAVTSSANDVLFDDEHKAELSDIDIALAQLTLTADDNNNANGYNKDDGDNDDNSNPTATAADAAT
jgi:Histone deacetylase domain